VDTNQIQTFIIIFSSILYEALPFIVLGAVVAGMLEELLPQQLVAKILPRSRFVAILIGGLLGLLFPMCECGIIPVMRRLLRKGVPLSACICYMLAGPIINVVVMLSTYMAFSGGTGQATSGSSVVQLSYVPMMLVRMGLLVADQSAGQLVPSAMTMMLLRMGLGYLVAVGTSLIVEWQYRKHGNSLLSPLVGMELKTLADEAADTGAIKSKERVSWARRLGNISETALHDFVDITAFLILGALLSATTHVAVPKEHLYQLAANYPLAILIMMGTAIVLCLCSEADAFVAASFSQMPVSAKIAFLVLGPMLDFKLYMMFTRVFRLRLIWIIIPSVVIQVYLYALLVHWVVQSLPATVTTP
jgi:uncharacterized membrane protein YraQ (UPF0718 family)